MDESKSSKGGENTGRTRSGWLLAGILCFGFMVRTLGPLGEPALGQTDAYGHLQFLTDMVTNGRLRHPLYPPGYYWLLALPTRLFSLDPYWVVRFAGAFFGVGLIWSMHFLTRRTFGVRAALWTAFLVAAFPAFHWLQKTGVGAYPVQLGLLLLPMILWCWDGVMREGWRRLPGLALGVVFLGLSVPMALLELLPFLALDFGVRSLRRETVPAAWIAAAVSIVALIGALGMMLVRGGLSNFVDTAEVVAGLSLPESSSLADIWHVIWAFVGPKRLWPSGFVIAAGAWVVGAALARMFHLVRNKGSLARMVALWALFAWSQTVFGVFQFPAYMRAGWPLLMAISILGGWVVVDIAQLLPPVPRKIGYGVLLGAGLFSLWMPPLPRPHLSPAESDLIVAARQLAAWSGGRTLEASYGWLNEMPRETLTVWSRPYNAFGGGQGDPLYALLQESDRIELRTVKSSQLDAIMFDSGRNNIILLDDRAVPGGASGLMSVVSPSLSANFWRMRDVFLSISGQLRQKALQAARKEGWYLEIHSQPQGLDIMYLNPSDD